MKRSFLTLVLAVWFSQNPASTAQTNALAILSTWHGHRLLGTSGIDTRDSAETHAMGRLLKPQIVRIFLDGDGLATNDFAWSDSIVALNAGPPLILCAANLDTNALVAALVRYQPAYVEVDSEPQSVAQFFASLNKARVALRIALTRGLTARPLLIGPSECNSINTVILDALVASNRLRELTGGIAFHCYLYADGNGMIGIKDGIHMQPDQPSSDGMIGTLDAQLAKLASYNRHLFCTEFGVPNNDPRCAAMLPAILAKWKCVVILPQPWGPQYVDGWQHCTQPPDLRYSDSLVTFLNAWVPLP